MDASTITGDSLLLRTGTASTTEGTKAVEVAEATVGEGSKATELLDSIVTGTAAVVAAGMDTLTGFAVWDSSASFLAVPVFSSSFCLACCTLAIARAKGELSPEATAGVLLLDADSAAAVVAAGG